MWKFQEMYIDFQDILRNVSRNERKRFRCVFEKAGISELCELFINQLGCAKKYTLCHIKEIFITQNPEDVVYAL